MRQRFQGGVIQIVARAHLFAAIQRNAAPAGYGGSGRERKAEITEMRIPSKGEIVRTDTAHKGEIVILPSDSVRLNDVLGIKPGSLVKRWREAPLPMLRTTIAPKTAAQRERLLDALIRNLRILTRFCAAKWIPSPMRSFFLFWAGCSWRSFPLCCRKNTRLKQW